MSSKFVEIMIILLGNSIKAYENRLLEIEKTEPIDEILLKSYKEELKEKYKKLDDFTIEKSILNNIDTKPALTY